MQKLVAAAVGVWVACCGLAVAGEPPTATAHSAVTQPAVDASVSDAVRDLGDADPQVRERATKLLWSRGRAAESALQAAAVGDDPEVARRAKSILRDFAYGLYPDAPREVFALLDQYRRGDEPLKRTAIAGLGARGIPGLRVLLKLREEEPDARLRRAITSFLGPREHEVAALMLADGDAEGVEKMLEHAAGESANAAQDYAAMLLLNGKLAGVLAQAKAQPITAARAPLLVALARAAGDLPTARAAAERCDNPGLFEAVLIEQGDWKGLAQRISSTRGLEPAEQDGYLCACYRLDGDQQAFQAAAQKLIAHGDAVPSDCWPCAKNLFLNDHAEDAILLLLKHNDYLRASTFLAPRLRFADAIELAKHAQEHQPGEVLKIKARTVGALQFIGETQKARELMAEVAAENRLNNDFTTWVYLIEDAQQLGLAEEANQYAAAALEKADPQALIAWMFEKMHLGDGSSAAQWWQLLRSRNAGQSVSNTLRELRSIYDGSASAEQWEDLTGAARKHAADLPSKLAENWELTVAQTLLAAGRVGDAPAWFSRIAAGATNPRSLIQVGDFEADRKRFNAAADLYDRAWQLDRTQPAPLFLKGWALAQSGRAKEGRSAMELAHQLPLGSEAARHALLEVLVKRGLQDDIRREVTLILTVTPPRSWERNEALRRAAEEAGGRGDYLTAAGLLERAFLPTLGNDVFFSEPWANVVVPAMIHKTRALGLIKAGQLDEAVREAKTSLEEVPADADTLIDLVKALDAPGHKQQADALYSDHIAVYRKLVAEYPKSGPAYNQLAWTQVECHRELDDALKNALRAVELEPASTASIDTLAEVYFARRDLQDAIKQINRCIELEPKVERHHRQLSRFRAALLHADT